MLENLKNTSKIVYGKDCIKKNTNLFTVYGKNCLIVTGKRSAVESGALADVKAALDVNEISYTVYDEIKENPLVSSVIKGGEIARNINAEFIIGIGGGSPLDAAKAIAICARNPQFDIDGLYKREIPAKTLPVVLVGTTSGTGSEVTGVSVLTNDNNMQKKSISGEDCYGAICFCDSKYTYSMNYDTTVSTALDAFAHAVESYFSGNATELSDYYAEKAIPLIYNGLKKLKESKILPDENLREQLFKGSIYAGLALNITGACFPHTVGYILTEKFNVPHGKACAALFPALMTKAKINKTEKQHKLLRLCGDVSVSIEETIRSLADVKIDSTEQDIKSYCERFEGISVKNFNNTPGGFAKEEAVKALLKLI